MHLLGFFEPHCLNIVDGLSDVSGAACKRVAKCLPMFVDREVENYRSANIGTREDCGFCGSKRFNLTKSARPPNARHNAPEVDFTLHT